MREKSLPQRIATLVLVAIVAATLLRTYDRLRSPPELIAPEAVERPDLVKWAVPGCYALRVDPWEWAPPIPDTSGVEPPAFNAVRAGERAGWHFPLR